MEYHFIHALILTSFESAFAPTDWSALLQEDYPIHCLYCQDYGRILLHSNNQKCDCAEEISKIMTLLTTLENSIVLTQQIVTLTESENEYCASDILNHLNRCINTAK